MARRLEPTISFNFPFNHFFLSSLNPLNPLSFNPLSLKGRGLPPEGIPPKPVTINFNILSQKIHKKTCQFISLRPQKHPTFDAFGTPKIHENSHRGPFGALLGQKAPRIFFEVIFWGTLFDPWASKVPSKTPPKKHLNFNASKIMKK